MTIAALLDEICRRGSLDQVLSCLASGQIAQLLSHCLHCLNDPRFSSTYIHLLQKIIRTNFFVKLISLLDHRPDLLVTSAVFKIRNKIDEALSLMTEIEPLIGITDMIIAPTF